MVGLIKEILPARVVVERFVAQLVETMQRLDKVGAALAPLVPVGPLPPVARLAAKLALGRSVTVPDV